MSTRTSLKVVLISMPDIVPVLPIPIDEGSVSLPNLGIAGVGGNMVPASESRKSWFTSRLFLDRYAMLMK